MKRRLTLASVLAAVVVSSGLVPSPSGADDTKTATIKEVMQKLHKGADSPLSKLKSALKADSPDWKKIQESTGEFATLGSALPKNDPPKGSKDDYKKLADAYCEAAKAIDDAAAKEDKTKAEAALDKISKSCMACHKAHKGS